MSKTYTLTEEEYAKVKHLIEVEEKKYGGIEDLVGGIVFIRTVTHYYTGRLVKIAGHFAVLEDAAWVADTGRFADFIAGREPDVMEVEPMGTTMVNLETVVDISPFKSLTTTQK